MPNLQKKRPLIFEIFNIKKCTLFFLEPSIYHREQRTSPYFHGDSSTLIIYSQNSF